jgi:SAM-dependent methyltransferase
VIARLTRASIRGEHPMNTTLLSVEDVLAGYDAMAALYPHIPSLCAWRGWEHAGYRRFELHEPVLDVGCGDGRFFRLIWPGVRDVVGVDIDPATVEASRAGGAYREVHLAAAHEVSLPEGSFGSAFANCALEHMDHIDRVLANICRSLKPGAPFVFSVVTEKWTDWSTLPLLVRLAGEPARADELQRHNDRYHHLMNGLSAKAWGEHLAAAGFDQIEHLPIVPEVTARMVTFLDHLWHLPYPGGNTGEVGGELHPLLMSLPDFPGGFRKVVEGLMRMEREPGVGAGAIFRARRKA